MKSLPDNNVDMTLTDIPYNAVSRTTNGLSSLSLLDNLGSADKATFNELEFCKEVLRITKGIICIFCSKE